MGSCQPVTLHILYTMNAAAGARKFGPQTHFSNFIQGLGSFQAEQRRPENAGHTFSQRASRIWTRARGRRRKRCNVLRLRWWRRPLGHALRALMFVNVRERSLHKRCKQDQNAAESLCSKGHLHYIVCR